MIGCIPCVIPCTGIVIICMTLIRIDMDPTYRSPPYLCSPVFSVIVTRLSVLCIINGEIPSPAIILITSFFKCIFFNVRRITLFSETRKCTTHIALTACDRTVATAAPRTPICSTKMNSGSRQIFNTAPIRTDNIAIFASPCPLM